MKYDMVAERKGPDVRISKAEDAWRATAKFHRSRKEHFLVLTLDGAHQVIRIRIITIGLLNRCLVHPREVYHSAILDGAAGIILAHNHPSGNLTPSTEDRDITRRLYQAGQIIGIPVLDHLILSSKGFYSFQETGELLNSSTY